MLPSRASPYVKAGPLPAVDLFRVAIATGSRTPGIRGVDFSFLDPPTLDVQFSPLGAGSAGFAVTDLPGVLDILRVCDFSVS